MGPQRNDRHHVRLFRAPGRVNLIGEHTDYNNGFVMPVAINLSTWVAISPTEGRKLQVSSENSGQQVELTLAVESIERRGDWSDYVAGVALMLARDGIDLKGASLRIKGEVPIGSGLSSSAALEVAVGLALSANAGVKLARTQLALLCQRAENEFVGARVGIMDQFVSVHGKQGHALLLDCRSLEFEHLPLSDKALLVVCNTMVKHELAASAYNERRQQCEEGVRFLAERLKHVNSLRDVSVQELLEHKEGMQDVIFRRCRHVVTENERVLAAARALRSGELHTYGKLMYESHRSLKEDYEVSCEELDVMVEIARNLDGVYGARMTGGGFGGCTVNLVEATEVVNFRTRIAERYQRATGLQPEIYVCEAANGAEEVLTEG